MLDEAKEQESQTQPWNLAEMAFRWELETGRRQQLLGAATLRMFEVVRLKPGDRVLDLAAGSGGQSMLAAQKVGPGGTVVATDISEEMLKIAAKIAQQQGLTNLTTRVMDAQRLELEENSFDAVICRNGLMFMPDPHQALAQIHRVLKPEGIFGALVWSLPERNPLFSLPLTLLSKYVRKPAFPLPDPFALADPIVFEAFLKQAGFQEIKLEVIPLQFQFPSIEAFLQTMKGMVTNSIAQINPPDQAKLLQEMKRALDQFKGPEGLVAPGESLLGVGVK